VRLRQHFYIDELNTIVNYWLRFIMAKKNVAQEEDADIMEFFESEDDAMLAKTLLDEYKNGKDGDGNAGLYEDYNVTPPSANMGGGYSMDDGYSARLTPRQVDTRYLLETKDDIPPHIKSSHWLLGSHHNELLNVQDPRQYAKFARENRDAIRTAGWQREHRKMAYSDVVQIESYANRLLTKSWKHGERLLQSTVITRNQNEDMGDQLPQTDSYGGTQIAGGLMGRIGKMFG
jgi:hypothetical protein